MNLHGNEHITPSANQPEPTNAPEISPLIDRINLVLEELENHYTELLAPYENFVKTECTQEKVEKMSTREYDSVLDVVEKVNQLRRIVRELRTVQANLIVMGFKKITEAETETEIESDLDEAVTSLTYLPYGVFGAIEKNISNLLQRVREFRRHYEYTSQEVPSLDRELTQLRALLVGEPKPRSKKRRTLSTSVWSQPD